MQRACQERKGKEGVAGWLQLHLASSLPALPVASHGLHSPSPSRCRAVDHFPRKDGQRSAPGCAAGLPWWWGVPGSGVQLGGGGRGRTCRKVCVALGKGEPGGGWVLDGGKEDDVDCSGSCNISTSELMNLPWK